MTKQPPPAPLRTPLTRSLGPYVLGTGIAAGATGLPVARLDGFGVTHQVLHLVHAFASVLFLLIAIPYLGRHFRELTGRRGASAWILGVLLYMFLRETLLRAVLPALVVVEYFVVLALTWRLVDRSIGRGLAIASFVIPVAGTLAWQATFGSAEAVVFPLFFYFEMACLLSLYFARPGSMLAPGSREGQARRSGLLLTFGLLGAAISGLFLGMGAGQMQTGDAFIGAHHVTSWIFLVAVALHPALVWRSRRRGIPGDRPAIDVRRWGTVVAVGTVAITAIVVGASWRIERLDTQPLPPPFETATMANPARWTTASGRTVPFAEIGDSERCRSCHPTQMRHWEASQHRHSAGPMFRVLLERTAASLGPEGARYCLGCHAPAAILSGALDEGGLPDEAALDAGVGCALCHGIEAATHPIGNASHVVAEDPRLILERAGAYQDPITGALFRMTPSLHSGRFAKPHLGSADLCGGCHRQELDPALGPHAAVLQDTLTPWRDSRFATPGPDDTPAATCIDCHMGRTALSENEEPIRDHRFFGGTVAFAEARGDTDTATMIEAWLAGDRAALLAEARAGFRDFWKRLDNPAQLGGLSEEAFESTVESLYATKLAGFEFPPEERWPSGPLLEVRATIEPEDAGAPARVRVSVRNRSIGHGFPGAPGDLVDAWIHVRVSDGRGEVLFERGAEGHDGVPDPDVRIGAIPVDASGAPIRGHRVWEVVAHEGEVIAAGETLERSWPLETTDATELRATAQVLQRLPGAAITGDVFGPDAPLARAVALGRSAEPTP